MSALGLLMLALLSETPAVTRSTPSATAPGMVVRVVGAGSTTQLLAGTAYAGKFRLTDGTLDVTLLNSAPVSDTGQVAVPVRVISSLASAGGGLTDTQLRATPVPISGSVTATGPLTDTQMRASAVPVSGPATDSQLRATPLPISGTVTASGPLTDTQLRASAVPVSGPATDAQMRATPIPVSGTVTATTGGLTDTQLRATPLPVSGTVTASGPVTDTQLRATPVPVSGTFYQSTQPISGTVADTGVDPNGTARALATTTGGILYVAPVATPTLPFPYRCNALRRSYCSP